jgi:TonB family protein
MNINRSFEKHKVEISITVGIYAVLLISMANIQILNHQNNHDNSVITMSVIEYEEPPTPEEIQEQIRERARRELKSNRAKNTAYDPREVSKQNQKYAQNMAQSNKSSIDDQIMQELKALEQQVIQDQRDAGIGYTKEEAEQLINSKKQRQKLERIAEKPIESTTKFDGETNITYKLENRYDTYIDVTIYKCQYAGSVTVNIAVDRNGEVVSAKIDDSSSSSDNCLQREALLGAKNTHFNKNMNADKLQIGSITFEFIPQ